MALDSSTCKVSSGFMKDLYTLIVPGTMLMDVGVMSDTFRLAVEFGARCRLHQIGPVRQCASPTSRTCTTHHLLTEQLAHGQRYAGINSSERRRSATASKEGVE